MNPVKAVIIFIFYVCLYPVGGGLTAAAAALVFTLLGGVSADPEDTKRWGVAAVIALVVAYFTIKTTARAEQFFAGSRVYRRLRHVVRLAMFGALGYLAAGIYIEGHHPGSDVSYFERMLDEPVLLLVPLGFVIFMAWLLRGGRMRNGWHEMIADHGINPSPPSRDSELP